MNKVTEMNLFDKNTTAPIIGIDLGTTNCAVTVYSNKTVPTLLSISGKDRYTMQSCILWLGGDNYLVGEEAYNRRYEPTAIYSAKRYMGTDKIYNLSLNGENKSLRPLDVAAIILKELKTRTEQFVNGITDCIITVPAYFDQRQIKDTLEAGKLAGWCVRQILKEPTSASYIYSQLGYAKNGQTLVYDLGGGTFDATYMTFLSKSSISDNMFNTLKTLYDIDFKDDDDDITDNYFCRVIATFGDTRLGGDDIDREFALNVMRHHNKKLNSVDFEKLVLECEDFKKTGVLAVDSTIGKNKFHLTMKELELATEKIFRKTLKIMEHLDKNDIKTIVLVGGSTKNLYLRKRLAEEFPNCEISTVLDPDSTVALGAGSMAKAIDAGEAIAYRDVLPLPIGFLVDEKIVEHCINANTVLPHFTEIKYKTMEPDQQMLQLKLYQGFSKDPKECTFLGTITVDNLPYGGEERLDVDIALLLNTQGNLKITSKVQGIEKVHSLVIDNIFSATSADEADTILESLEQDDFVTAFYDKLKDNQEAIDLLFKRQELIQSNADAVEIESIEDKIFDMI